MERPDVEMKTVAIPVLEGHRTLAVFPHNRQDEKVNLIVRRFYVLHIVFRISVLSL